MYFSFSKFPEIKGLSKVARYQLYKKISVELKLGNYFFKLIMVSFLLGLVLGGILDDYGVKGDLLGYIILTISFSVWYLGYIYSLNKMIYPAVKKYVRKKTE